MNDLLLIFIFLPLLGFVISLLIPERKEALISWAAFGTMGLQLFAAMGFSLLWIFDGAETLNAEKWVLYSSVDYRFFIDLYFDKITATYLFVGALLSFMVAIYSRFYMHRERGYKRFFNTILFFFVGYNITIFAGNIETLFIGWEVLGISSFLLIAFYRDRYLPVKNAVKVFSIYRVGDIGLILAMWMSHHLWHKNITFWELGDYNLVHEHLQSHSNTGFFISLMILIAAAAKSAQLPFSSWLPRAMEGPTPSSAIFYGSLSVHIGVFIMLRTYPFWEHQILVRVLTGFMGLSTAFIATGIGRVQSSVKSQIAYGSIAQIGLIFIEVAAGWHNLALVHFAGNAFLRTYQLLVSPSVVTYLIREQFYSFKPHDKTLEDYLPSKLENTLYILSLKEWNLDTIAYQYFWNPLKRLGQKLNFLTFRVVLVLFAILISLGLIALTYVDHLPEGVRHNLPGVLAFIGLVTVLKAFTERRNVKLAWLLVMMNHFWIAVAISFNEHFSYDHLILYLSGVVVAGLAGYLLLLKLQKSERGISLNRFQGHTYEHPRLAFVFLLACLGLAGFPISPTFVGEDLIFSHIHEDQYALASFTAMSFIIDGLAIIRIYARIFMGPHHKAYHEIAYRSS